MVWMWKEGKGVEALMEGELGKGGGGGSNRLMKRRKKDNSTFSVYKHSIHLHYLESKDKFNTSKMWITIPQC